MGHWNPVFTRLNKDWEMRELKAFFRGLHKQVLRRDDEDVMSWRVSKKDLFTVKSFYSLVPCNAREFPSSIGWNPGVLKRVSFLCLGSYLGENPNYGSTQKEGLVFTKQVFFV